jgi:hypothetical protein
MAAHRGAQHAAFCYAVTLEDIGILPDPALVDGGQAFPFRELRASGRIPLLARLNPQKKGAPESFMLWFGSGQVSNATYRELRAVANAGARIYLEGAPLLDENGKPAPWRMSTLVGADVTPQDQGCIERCKRAPRRYDFAGRLDVRHVTRQTRSGREKRCGEA